MPGEEIRSLELMGDEPAILRDRSTGRPILMAPDRLERPRDTDPTGDPPSSCPFCEGNESLTRSECDAIRDPGSESDSPGWTARCFPNLYPACSHHEVIVEGGAHSIHPAEIPRSTLAASLSLCRRRMEALESQPEVRLALLFKNVGSEAGASIGHNHCQLMGLPFCPPRLEQELQASLAGCVACEEMAGAGEEGRLVFRTEGFAVICPSTPKISHEVWLLPVNHADDFLRPAEPDSLAAALDELYSRARDAFPSVALNLVLHRIPGEDFHWHFELQPRCTKLAGLEIGADVYVNPVTPHASAARWRGESQLRAEGVRR